MSSHVGIATIAALSLIVAAGAGQAQDAPSGSSIVEEAIRGAQEDQRRDQERVRGIIDEAVRGAEEAPSGQATVRPPPPDTLQPLPADAPASLPPGTTPDDLLDRPIHDATGAEIGKIQGLVLDEASGLARAMIAFGPLFGEPPKSAPVEIEVLQPSDGGYVLDLNPLAYQELPAYVRDGERWRRA